MRGREPKQPLPALYFVSWTAQTSRFFEKPKSNLPKSSQNKAPWKISAPSNIPSLSGMNLRPWARNLNPQLDSAKTVKPVRAQQTEVNMHPVGLTWEMSILTLWFTLTVNMCSLMDSLRVCLQEGYASFPICFHGKICKTVEFVSGWSCAHNA